MSAPDYLVAEALKPFLEVERIVLFGSRPRVDAALRSDIDLAIACPRADPKNWSDMLRMRPQNTSFLSVVDVVDNRSFHVMGRASAGNDRPLPHPAQA
jgi:predicted nucleotidyltransferase